MFLPFTQAKHILDRIKRLCLGRDLPDAGAYQVLLLTEKNSQVGLSVAHKRWAQNEADKTVLNGEILVVDWDKGRDRVYWPAFRASLALGRQPTATLHAFYQGWIGSLLALLAARITGELKPANELQDATGRYEVLNE